MTIMKIEKESWPSLRFIGKKYPGPANWGEWWANGWFDILEALPVLELNLDSYTEGVRIFGGKPEHWLGMFFPGNTQAPEGFEAVDIPAMDFALCYLYGDPDNGELFGLDAHNQCLELLKERGMTRRENDWCFQRCVCPRFTTPDENGKVTLDYLISLESR